MKKIKLKILLALLVPFVVLAITVPLVLFVGIRSKWYRNRYYFRKDKNSFGGHLCFIWADIHGSYKSRWRMKISLNSWHPHWEIEKQGDGEDGRGFQIVSWLPGVSIYITASGMFPEGWFKDESYNGKIVSYINREYGVSFHHWRIWLEWAREDNGMTKDRGLHYSFSFKDFLIGKHSCRWEILGYESHKIAMYEGAYNVVVFKRRRIDSWQRWLSKKRVQWEVICGTWQPHTGFVDGYNGGWYIGDEAIGQNEYRRDQCFEYRGDKPSGNFINYNGHIFLLDNIRMKLSEKFVPVPGKGENSWDCGEDGTQSILFGVDTPIRTYVDAANAFQASVQKTRLRYGGKDWMPERYNELPVNVIN